MSLEGDNTVSTSYGDVEIPSAETGSAPQASQTPSQGQSGAPPWWEQHANSELEFAAAGKQIKAPLSRVKQWAQQGYDYAQRMQAFNAERQAFEAKQSEFGKDAEWAEVVKFARENPEWAQHTRSAWEQRQNWNAQGADPADPVRQEIMSLKAKIGELEPEVTAFRSERQAIKAEKEDKALDAEMSSIREKYSKFGMDLTQIDPETGTSYEYAALKYGSENGIKSFKTAFLELYGDKIEAMREEAIKKQFAEEHAKRQKEGFIGRSPTPINGQAKAQNVRNRSWSNIAEEALADLQAGKY